MGTHGASNAVDELMGSNTLHVIKKMSFACISYSRHYKKITNQ